MVAPLSWLRCVCLQYTFLDPGISGVGGAVTFCAVMLVAFIALGYVLFGFDRLLGKVKSDE